MPHKKALCLSQHMCEKSLASQKIRNSGQRNAGGDRRQEWTKVEKKKRRRGEGENVHERCVWCGTYCSRTHRSGRGSPALRHTDNLPGCRCDRSGIQTAQEHTCHRGPWWLQTFSTTLITHRQRRRFRVQSLIEDPTRSLPSRPSPHRATWPRPSGHQAPRRFVPNAEARARSYSCDKIRGRN